MKKFFMIAVLALTAVVAMAQQALFDSSRVTSPKINADGSVTFSLVAPDAQDVKITSSEMFPEGSHEVAMVKGADGVWTYTSPVLKPELYLYNFLVDGVKVTDPSNVYMIRDIASVFSTFIVGGEQTDYYKVQNVPHGSVTRMWYDSPTLGMKRRLTVYTPAGYETSTSRYPVFYLLHGMGGDEEAWMALGRASQILDNLIAQGKAKPMIVVMTNGNASEEAAPGETQYNMLVPTTKLPKTMDGAFEMAFPEVVKFIDNTFRTIPEKHSRAIAGLSMGGFHSLHISKYNPDMFDYVGLFSAAIFKEGAKSPIYDDFEGRLKAQFAKKPALYYIAIGKDDFLYNANKEFRAILDKNHLPYHYVESTGGHQWRNWRIYLTDFAPRLFH